MISRVVRSGLRKGQCVIRKGSRIGVSVRPFASPLLFQQIRFVQFNAMGNVNVDTMEQPIIHPPLAESDPLANTIKSIHSFDDAIAAINGYANRPLEANFRILEECGRYSPGVLCIQDTQSQKQVVQFIRYLNNTIKEEDLSSVNLYYIIRAFWALPRLGCTYTSNSNQNTNTQIRLVDIMLSSILNHYDTLTPIEWSVVLKSLGKLRYFAKDQVYDTILNSVFASRQSFDLPQLCDVVWGLLRLKVIEKKRIIDNSLVRDSFIPNLLNDNRYYLIFQQIEELINKDSASLKYLRSSRLSNLIYSISYTRYPNRVHLLNQLIPSVMNVLSELSMTEIATIFTGYTESHITNPKLMNGLIKAFISNTDISSTNALSFLYSYSRSVNRNQLTEISVEMIDKLNSIIVDMLPSMNDNELVYLVSIYNNLNFFPQSLSRVYEKLNTHVSSLNDDQCFTLLCTIMKSQTRDPAGKTMYYNIYKKYIKQYESSSPKTGVYSNILCMLFRYAISHDLYLNPYLTIVRKDFNENTQNYNSRAISNLLHCISHMKKVDVPLYSKLLCAFSSQCTLQNDVTEYDIIYALSSVRNLTKEPAVASLLPPLAASINQWCNRHVDTLSPHLLSFLILKYPMIHQSTDGLIRLFETRYVHSIKSFPIQDKVVLLKAFAVNRYEKESIINAVYKSVEDVIPSMSSQDLLSVLWTIAQRYTSQVKVYAEVKDELSKRDLTPTQKKNYQDIVNLFISHSYQSLFHQTIRIKEH